MLKTKFSLLFILFLACSIKLNAQLNANFLADTTEGCGSLSGVQFSDLSAGSPNSWKWDFGNGNSSTLPSPSANYTATGNYTVSLIVGDGSSFDTLIKTAYIKIYNNPIANFTFSPNTGCVPLTVNFINSSTLGDAPIQSFLWDYRDGNQGQNVPNPQHIYQTGGVYSPNLQITDQNNCTDNISLGPINAITSPVAAFSTAGPKNTCRDSLVVNFVNNSSGASANATYLWSFGDGTTSTLVNPTHTYRGFGSYTVGLTITNPNCNAILIELDYVNLVSPNTSFTLPKKKFCLGEKFQINNLSIGASAQAWDFGDGTSSSELNPKKTYQDSGVFVITLTTSGLGCIGQYKDTIYVQEVVADFITDTTFSCNPYDSVFFLNTSTNAIKYAWRIGWGGVGSKGDSVLRTNSVHVRHYYNERPGIFSDTLIAESSLGCRDTIIKDSNRVVDLIALFITDQAGIALGDFVEGCLPINLGYSSLATLPLPGDTLAYNWDFGTGQKSTDKVPSFTFIYNNDSSYTVSLKVVSGLGCTMTDSVVVQPGRRVVPMVNIFPDSVCQLEDLTIQSFNPLDSLVNEFRYTINSRRGGITNESDTAGTVFNHYNDTGYHSITINHSYNGCDTAITIDSAFYVKGPVITFDSIGIDCSDRKKITVKASILGATRFYWDFGDGSPLDSVNTTVTHIYTNLQIYNIRVTAFNDDNDCPKTSDTLRVEPFEPALNILPAPLNFCLNETVRFLHTDTAQYDTSQWWIDNQFISNKGTFTHQFNTRGSFPIKVRAVDHFNCVKVRLDTLYISQPKANFSTNFLNNCLPLNVQFSDSTASDTTIITNYWIKENGDTLFPPQPITQYTAADLGSKDVYYYVLNTFGCADSILKPDLIPVNPYKVEIRSASNLICVGDSSLFRNVSSNLNGNFIWDFGDGSSMNTNEDTVKHQFNQAGIYTISLTGTDQTGCVKSDTWLVNVQSNPVVGFTADTLIASCYPLAVNFQDTSKGDIIHWVWRFGDQDTAHIPSPFHNYLNPGSYNVFLKVTTSNGCSDSIVKQSYITTVGPTATMSIDKDIACVNEPITFTIGNLANVISYLWDFGDGETARGNTVTHTYKRTGKIYPSLILNDTSAICRISILDSLTIHDVKADFTVVNDTGCVPLNSIFTNTSNAASSIKWNFGQGSSSTNQIDSNLYTSNGSYQVSLAIESFIGCFDTAYKNIEVYPTPNPNINPDTNICFGDSILLVASDGDFYVWKPNQFISSLNNDSTVVFPDTSTLYTVTVSSLEGCVDSAKTNVNVISFTDYSELFDSTIYIGETIALSVNAGPFFNYRWTPPNGLSCSDCPNPIAKPLSNQQYIVNISDEFGCFNVNDTIDITVTEAYSLDVPKAFSPNGDGVNDMIYAKGWGLKELISFKIYNRFGELVFESRDFNLGWDGSYRNKAQNVETYIYTVEALTYGNKVLSKKGNITLLR